jgi:hypothetical protein
MCLAGKLVWFQMCWTENPAVLAWGTSVSWTGNLTLLDRRPICAGLGT